MFRRIRIRLALRSALALAERLLAEAREQDALVRAFRGGCR